MRILHEETKGIGRFYGEDAIGDIEISYHWVGADRIVISHTFVANKYSGQGLGTLLVEEVVGYAREKHAKIKSDCLFARSVLKKHDEFRDVVC